MSFSKTYEYKVIYSRRRSICVSISDENALTVRCPIGTSKAEIERFLASKSKWIRCNMEKIDAVYEYYSDVISLKKILVGGELFDLIIGGRDGMTDCTVYVGDVSHLKKVYTQALGGGFCERVGKIAEKLGLKYSGVSLKSYRARWGCCDAKNFISFNYKLLMLPPRVQDCVIVHELCHTVHHNHSAAFHRLFDRIMPDHTQRERELKTYSFVARLY